MNIVIENLNSSIIDSISIATIKKLTGSYDITTLFGEISSLNYEKAIIDITALNNYNDINNLKSLISFVKLDKLILVMSKDNVDINYLNTIIEAGIYNIAYTAEHIVELYSNPNNYEDAVILVNKNKKVTKIIGFKNVTKHAGSTTLIYILKKHLDRYRKVLGIEIDKLDFNFFYNKEMISIQDNAADMTLEKYGNVDIILVDLNNSKNMLKYCDDVIYLVEPTMIKINEAMMVNPTTFSDLKDSKVILNKSPLTNDEVKEFELESHIKAYYVLPMLNERHNSDIVNGLIDKLKL